MGILNAGIMGAMYGKLGGMIGSNWKGINTLREYKIPANPQSVAQTAQRTKFSVVVALAQSLLGTLITTFWNPFAVKMSGFNAFIKSVFPNVSANGLVTASCKVTSGTLESSTAVGSPTYNTSDGGFTFDFDGTPSGNGLATDNVNLLVLNITNNSIVHYEPSVDTRTSAGIGTTIPTGLDATDLVAFIWFSRGTGSTFVVSDSIGALVTEP